ncbi:MAG: cupredoxin family copper-binding protein [Methylobacteriaceae bacterium]|nr:cupredoxin family copper-binding protein [Methylobacteriaceae bacterium]
MNTLLSRRSFSALIFALPLLRPAQAEEEAAHIMIDNFVFSPPELKVKTGTKVTWKNGDDIPHTVMAKGGLFRSKPLDTGDEFSYVFAKAGKTDYFCTLHPHMVGTVIVAD